jgi:Na+/phosphate symporter
VDTLFRQLVRCQDKQQCWSMLRQHVTNTQNEILTAVHGIFTQVISGLVNEDVRRLREAQTRLEETRSLWKRYKRKEILGMRKISQLQAVEKNTWFHLNCNNVSQMLYGLKRMTEPILEHVDNNFNPLEEDYVKQLLPLSEDVENYIRRVQGMIVSGEFSRFDEGIVEGNALKARISDMRHKLQHEIQHQDANIRVALLYLNTLQEVQELTSTLRHMLRSSKRFQE